MVCWNQLTCYLWSSHRPVIHPNGYGNVMGDFFPTHPRPGDSRSHDPAWVRKPVCITSDRWQKDGEHEITLLLVWFRAQHVVGHRKDADGHRSVCGSTDRRRFVFSVCGRPLWRRLMRRKPSSLVFESPVSRPEKDWNWTGLDRKKDQTAVLVFHI